MEQQEYAKLLTTWLEEIGLSKIGKWEISNAKDDIEAVVVSVRCEHRINNATFIINGSSQTHNDIEGIKSAVQSLAENLEIIMRL